MSEALGKKFDILVVLRPTVVNNTILETGKPGEPFSCFCLSENSKGYFVNRIKRKVSLTPYILFIF